MTTSVKQLLSKIEKLERDIYSLNSSTKEISLSKFYTLRKDLLSYPCISETKISFENITFKVGDKILIESQIEFVSQIKQRVEISIVLNDCIIEKISRISMIGNNIYSLSKMYTSKIDKIDNIYIFITPKEEKEIIISSALLNIYGADQEDKNKKYQLIKIEDKYLVSQLIDDIIYYKIITNNEVMLGEIDFEYFGYAKDFSFVYLSETKKIYLLKIDFENNLLFEDMSSGVTKIIDKQVEKISAASTENLLEIVFLKNDKCYVCDYEEGEFSLPKKCYDYKTQNCQIFYDKFSQKFCINLSFLSGKNLLLFEQKSNAKKGESLSLDLDIILTSVGAENGSWVA